MRISTKHLRTSPAHIASSSSSAAALDGGRRLKKKKSERNKDLLIRTTDSDVLQFHGNQGLFGRCRGDCDSSDDCMPGLVCLERAGIENNVPGCDGVAVVDVDYCVSPSDIDDEQRQDDGGDPNSDSTDPKQNSTPVPTVPPTIRTEPSPSPPTSSSSNTAMPTLSPTSPSPTSSPTTTGTVLVTDFPTFRMTFDVDDDELVVNLTPTPSPTISTTTIPTISTSSPRATSQPTESSTYIPTTTSSATNSKVIAAISTSDQLTSSQSGANTFDIKSTSGYAVMGLAFLSLLVLAVVGLAVRNRKKRAAAAEIKSKPSLSTVIVPFDDSHAGRPRWGDGSTINQLTQAFESENMGIEVIDIRSNPSIRSAPSADSFDAEPNPLPYDESLHKKYPKLFGLPQRDEYGEIGPMDTIEL
mmetsp:Transcript_14556/g.24245  ORF Transcript_14556/g.24245 Transcript_14556/m.24245 type:complete len:414 (-) Transcript_14556:1558-2799(-)|eukprot:CAMPEP_0197729216 /NCGR_PEP_ID=MMETSP1434-20131217/29786_1 /TAXON_ID=265543 /ORGANISM="Minutocellus polymorphus, Strain CCMP3303" /LENGTH=413 /DNA_ID=CAMNT_0043315817 /DNA_START=50 /DNA_END=1291 /DNA_ORIENTATION=+